jgi:hypothetical protein
MRCYQKAHVDLKPHEVAAIRDCGLWESLLRWRQFEGKSPPVAPSKELYNALSLYLPVIFGSVTGHIRSCGTRDMSFCQGLLRELKSRLEEETWQAYLTELQEFVDLKPKGTEPCATALPRLPGSEVERGRSAPEGAAADNAKSLDAARSAIDGFARLPAKTPEPELRESAMQALKALQCECLRVRENAKDYPANPIIADVWLEGAVLGVMAEGLAALLNQRGLTDLEEKAHTLRCMAVLAVQSHYHHIVGPAMLARAECNERLGNAQLAGQICQAVVADLTQIVDEWAGTGEAPTDVDRISLECLLRAVEGVLRLRPAGTDLRAMEDLHLRCAGVLARESRAESGRREDCPPGSHTT